MSYKHHTAAIIVASQLAVAIAVAVGSLLWVDLRSAYSALLGGMISAVASAYLAARILGFDDTVPPAGILRAFYLGEFVKILITVSLFALVIALLEVDILFMLSAYILTLPVYWFALLAPGPRMEKDSRA